MSNKASRNGICPCGSGKKFKKCCGLTEQMQKQAKAKPFKLGSFANIANVNAKSLANRMFKVVKKAEPQSTKVQDSAAELTQKP
jgi:hypothetical protein